MVKVKDHGNMAIVNLYIHVYVYCVYIITVKLLIKIVKTKI